ncbi:MAG: response regulator [Patescibacteria group bacterium]
MEENRRFTVMIVDDDQSLARALSRRLVDDGYSVIYYQQPQQALLAFQLDANPPIDLLVTDMDMSPEMSGWDLVQEIRGLQTARRVGDFPIILWSGGNLTGRAFAGDGGADCLLNKSNAEDLFSNIRRLLNQE